MGAKNHCIVLPDANKNKTLSQIAGAAFGAAGQRCMALSVAIFVGRSKEWIPELVEAARRLKVDAGHVPGADLGPVISPEAKQRICELVEAGVKDGAKLALDGRSIVVPGYENGNFVGPTILTDVNVSVYFELDSRVMILDFFKLIALGRNFVRKYSINFSQKRRLASKFRNHADFNHSTTLCSPRF